MKYGRSGGKNAIFRLFNKYFVFSYHLHIGGNISGDRRLGLVLFLGKRAILW